MGIQLLDPIMADLYFPDDLRGHAEANRMLALVDIDTICFCSEFLPMPGGDRTSCNRKDVRALDGFNKCLRCPAGYLFASIRGQLTVDSAESAPCVL